MYRSFFTHELGLMVRSKKNLYFILFLLLGVACYCLIILPDKQTVHVLDHEEIAIDLENDQFMLEGRVRSGYTGTNSRTGRAIYVETFFHNQLRSKLIHAYENQDAARYLRLKLQYDVTELTVISDPSMFEGSTYPNMDRMHFEYYTDHRYQSLLHMDSPLTLSMLEQKSAIQVLEQALLVAGPWFIFLAIYFSCDVLMRDREHPSIKQGMPISWYKIINLKSGVVLTYTATALALLLAFCMLLVSILNGFGHLDLAIPYLTSFDDLTSDQYDLMSMGTFLLKSLVYLVILLFLFIRLTMVGSLLLKQAWLVLGVTSFILLFERVFRDRTSETVLGIDVGYWPQTYIDFGKIAAGEMNYLFMTDSITFISGLVILLLTVVMVEGLLLTLSKIITKERYYA
ncbi:hypothetical protein [Alkalicoccobacillus porphyridii]|uniref:Uncharacterized protein n=1 Tax=Alkalicoccobacillus porphyridii TaxID=2597270 RepID=A0A554A0Z4_9BACI|nr:hypothetical protein [Alkalicoccobacillus porphyridii]TSB47355.1 hypothetical protein FN960_06345 [Alkalicoccobacillus porphyridii]